MPKAKTTTKKKSRLTKKQMKKALKPVAAKRKAQSATNTAAAAEAAAFAQPCLDSLEAGFIVGSCLLPGTHNNDDTLEETGLFTPELRLIFRECVFNGVTNAGCEIDRGQIPSAADATVGQVRQAVFRNSR